MPTLKEIEACQDYICENSSVDLVTGCWIWNNFKDKNGRGYGRAAGFKDRLVHRLAWAAFEGGGRPYPGALKMICAHSSCCYTGHMPRPNANRKPQENGPTETARPPGRIVPTAVITCREASISHEPPKPSDEPGLTWEEVFVAFFTRGK